MNQANLKLRSVERWIATSRSVSPQLEMEADSRLGRLSHLSFDPVDALAQMPMTLGLYGHSPEGKHHLLSALIEKDGYWPGVLLGDKTFNYLTHINPGVAPLMAVRFTQTRPPKVDNYPLLLELYSETMLAIKLMQRYHEGGDVRKVTESDLAIRLATLQARRLPHPASGGDIHRFAAVTQAWKNQDSREDGTDDGLLYQIAELAGWLSISDRASLFSFLWGDDPAVTEEWTQLAYTLAQLGHAEQVLAPASLIVDNMMLPAEGFLIPACQDKPAEATDVMICPLENGQPGTHVSLNSERLAQLCACLTLTIDHDAPLGNIDIIDIPVGELDSYARRLQPDTLLMCNVVTDHQHTAQTAQMLCNWLDRTQDNTPSPLPRLVWAVTPFDLRFQGLGHLDDGVQHLLNRAGKHWGILQALDNHNLFTLREWLKDALTPKYREQRLSGLRASRQACLDEQLFGLLTPTISRVKEAENLVRALQTHSAHFGELVSELTLSRSQLHQCWLQYQQKPGQTLTPDLTLDLFATDTDVQPAEKHDVLLADIIYKRWVNHVRQLSWRTQIVEKLGLPKEQLSALCNVLIISAHHLGLCQHMQQALAPHDKNMALAITCASNVFSDYISWLGYQHVPVDQRPESKVNPGRAIFAPVDHAGTDKRLTQLGEQQVLGHTRYIYDWLVGLYHRATDCITSPYNTMPEAEMKSLLSILNADAPADTSP
ncbi:hypothetical protein C3432_25970 [Citrobacter amalonaticus]|uniref:Bacterial virulence factor n=1 Tax=Citrobacter amalonaticus TaxID=35703 RepID=A0A2S4RRE4_CITAM|nr:virulence factor SrfC family protein [Citrobacter amalonaticus]POT54737.1 hypothetical protein C3432_25970 [Citrobacter amalonaticus]POT69945.1 hypothetical protein C3436_25765 [Citrobacter amalonaticus]POU61204.1 hypothetical protein C3430_24680 [Citrobacter amalonaticus]POV02558.1 hypothetical protein C3424_26010 [Citrobacter amalonaticus]